MPTLPALCRTILAILAAGTLLTQGCTIVPRRYNFGGQVSPALYCPGDTLVYRYDIEGDQPCVSRSGFLCADLAPTVNVTTSSASWPSGSFRAFSGAQAFSPTEVLVTGTTTVTPRDMIYPILDRDGRPGFASRELYPRTFEARRLEGEISEAIQHPGSCSGGSPTTLPGTLAGYARYSSSMVADRVCNDEAQPMTVSAGGRTEWLSPGECMPLGVQPAGLVVQATPGMIDPAARCEATQQRVPPRTLRTRVFLRCGN